MVDGKLFRDFILAKIASEESPHSPFTMIQPQKLETFKIFKIALRCYKLLGLLPSENSGILYYFYIILINTVVSIGFPGTQFIDLVMSDNLQNVFRNSSICSATIMASIKAFNIIFRRKHLHQMNDLLHKLDKRQQSVADPDEIIYLRRIVKIAYRILLAYVTPFAMAAFTCVLPAVFSQERRLVYAAWFPFDWRNSDSTYYKIATYQVLASWGTISQNILNDSYPGLYLWVLKGHFRALNIRVAKIGYDGRKTTEEHYAELVKCITDHIIILEYRKVFENMFGGVLLMQFLVSEISVCITAIWLLYADTMAEKIYIVAYFVCVFIEILLPCYCGNEIIHENNKFTTALFSCNWTDQDRKFKQTLIFIMQNTVKPLEIYAGQLVRVSLSTLLTVLKSTYSLFAVMKRLR